MATKKSPPSLIQGHATHTRTQDSYMAAMLKEVDMDDWRGIVRGAVVVAKDGDAQARTWLAQYLVVNRLADKLTAPSLDIGGTGNRAQITQQLKAELATKVQQARPSKTQHP